MKEKDDKLNYQNFIEESFEDLYEQAPCGYFSSLPDGTIVKINQTLSQWLGYPKSEILHRKKFQDLLPIGGKIFYETHHAPLMRMQGSINEINYDLVTKSGTLLPVLINSFHIKDAEGTVILYRSTVVNIADRKKYEVELLQAKKKAEQAAQAKAEFLSTISHEIRTPMNAIIGIANLLQETNPTAQQQVYLKILKNSSENLLNLINDILDFNKIESGKLTLEEKVFNIQDLIQTVIYNYLATAEEKELLLDYQVDDSLPQNLIGDPVKITQVLTNLIGNAIKFTHTGSIKVDLKASKITQHDVVIEFTVTDTGIGIASDKIQKIFEEFSQADYEINMHYGGTGLGLAISKKLLAMYGTALHVESELGKGSQFSFSLKLKISQEQPEISLLPTSHSGQHGSLQGVKLLLAEDNSVNIFIASQYLKSWDVEFDIAKNGSEAIEKILQQEYDLVLMDLQMPQLNGYDASRTLRNRPEDKYKKLPIVALSASSKFDIKHRLEHAGINDFISKPFDPKELFNKIALYGSASIPYKPDKSAELSPETKDISLDEKSALINLQQFRKLTKNNASHLTELIELSIENFVDFKENFRKALDSHDLSLLEDTAHKSKMTIQTLEASQLFLLIEKAIKLMKAEDQDEAFLQAISEEIGQKINEIITVLKQSTPDNPNNQATSLP